MSLALPAVLLAAGGCRKTETVLGEGRLDRSVRFVGVPRQLAVANTPALLKRGDSTNVDVNLRNDSTRGKLWELEYQVQFFDGEGRALPGFPRGWTLLAIGRGEMKTISGSCQIPGTESCTVTVRGWRAKE
jgi:hypothetical protein